MIKDRNIGYTYKREWFPVNTWNCWHTVGGVLTMSTTGSAELQQAAEGMIGAKFDTNNLGSLIMPKPSEWDFENDVFVRVIWSDQGGSDSAVTWTFNWRNFSFGAANATPTGVLDTVLESDAHGKTNDGVNATKWGKLSGGSITPVSEGESFVRFDVKLTVDSGNIDPVLHGVEVAYLPKLTDGAQNKLTDDPTDA